MEDAPLYHKSNQLQIRDAQWALNKLVPTLNLDKQCRILDIGCGAGDVTESLLLRSMPATPLEIIGVDASHEMVEYASKNSTNEFVSYFQMDAVDKARAEQLFTQPFDLVTSFYCLHWITDQKTCLEIIYDALEIDGKVLIVFLASNQLFESYEALSIHPEWRQYMADITNFIPPQQYKKNPAEEFEKMAIDVGFEVNVCEAVHKTFAYKNLAELRGAVAAVNPFLKRIPNDRQDAYMNDLIEDICSRCPKLDNTNNPVSHYKLMIVTLTKAGTNNINTVTA